jgi:hypothetical protein
MTSLSIDQLYEQIRPLSRADRLRLLARIADDLAAGEERLHTAPALLRSIDGERVFHCAAELSAHMPDDPDADYRTIK